MAVRLALNLCTDINLFSLVFSMFGLLSFTLFPMLAGILSDTSFDMDLAFYPAFCLTGILFYLLSWNARGGEGFRKNAPAKRRGLWVKEGLMNTVRAFGTRMDEEVETTHIL